MHPRHFMEALSARTRHSCARVACAAQLIQHSQISYLFFPISKSFLPFLFLFFFLLPFLTFFFSSLFTSIQFICIVSFIALFSLVLEIYLFCLWIIQRIVCQLYNFLKGCLHVQFNTFNDLFTMLAMCLWKAHMASCTFLHYSIILFNACFSQIPFTILLIKI